MYTVRRESDWWGSIRYAGMTTRTLRTVPPPLAFIKAPSIDVALANARLRFPIRVVVSGK